MSSNRKFLKIRTVAVTSFAVIFLALAAIYVHQAKAQSNQASATPLSDSELIAQFQAA